MLLAPATACAHRLDEYLQATLISVQKDALHAELELTPGVAVYPAVAAQIDTDGDGAISESEQRAYAERVLDDLRLTIDGRPLRPRLVSMRFLSTAELMEGLGAIRIEFQATLPRGGSRRRIVFENRHQSRIGVYLVNCLVPSDPDIRIEGQRRNYLQTHYELDYTQAGVSPAAVWMGWMGERAWIGAVALLLVARFAMLWRRRVRAAAS